MDKRIETDYLGSKEIPANVFWGIHTLRAKENFSISGTKTFLDLIYAITTVKKACAQANTELEYLDNKIGVAIIEACDEILNKKYDDQFVIDAFQGGAGTSTNMNINEVIANVALVSIGVEKGTYSVISPLNHVNLHQSTNDIYPTGLKIALITLLRELSDAIEKTQGAFQIKEKQFSEFIKIGRTELQEAVPLTLGAEFSAFSEAVSRDRWRTFKCEERIRMTNLGGTAVGTGLTAPRRYIFLVQDKLRALTGYGISRAENSVDQTANSDCFVEISGILKAHASNLLKIGNDLRLLHMLNDIKLQAMQPGSSIMPGKINPVIPELVMQAALRVIANDHIITECTSRSSLQINEFIPLLAHALIESLRLLIKTNKAFQKCIDGISVNNDKSYEHSETLITAFLPQLGYEKASQLLQEYNKEKNTIPFKQFLINHCGKEIVESVLSPYSLTALGYNDENYT